jgi:hypothetical protein
LIYKLQAELFSDLHPDLCLHETNPAKREEMKKRTVKVIFLKHPQVDHLNFTQLLSQEEEKDEEEAEEDLVFREAGICKLLSGAGEVIAAKISRVSPSNK